MTEPQIPQAARRLFLDAGWHEGRSLPVAGVPSDHPAYAILAEFGGLRVGAVGSGETCARSDLQFGRPPSQDWEAEVSALVGSDAIAIGEIHNAHELLLIDAPGRVFSTSYMHDAVCLQGATFAEALANCLLGRKARPILAPGQVSVDLYGETYFPGDPRLFQP